ncbi:MAG: Fe(3+)-hydroxamate ABC transporter permease FhuB [Candidatus Competibacteraceae bacterium]|nr:Fe(3+)-hydroxamate ABC transporter permease FhuB [Candidatus Competibacteraceae bacterium]
MSRWPVLALGILIALPAHIALSVDLPLAVQGALLMGREPLAFEEVLFVQAAAPRAVIALLVGGALGLAGSVLQQITGNRLVSPLTIGASSGAWLALVIGSVVAPVIAARHGLWFSLSGAVLATLLVLVIAGWRNLGGLPVVLAGMAVNILLGAVATMVILLNDQYVRNYFIWGAGDLTQTDWSWVTWLAPQLILGLGVMLLCRRPLTVLRLGMEGARGRGLNLGLFMAIAMLAALWLTASAITAVGVIGFIGLLAPNIARMIGARTTLEELLSSLLLGALLLLVTDGLALLASHWSRDLVPSGASAALIGAPALIWLSLGRLRAQDQTVFQLPRGRSRLPRQLIPALVAACGLALVIAISLGPSSQGWRLEWPSSLILSLRWPRMVTALAAGAGMAVSGVILQRLLRNPLASPDIIGISSGATLALVGAMVLFGTSLHQAGTPVALLGSLGALVLLIGLTRRHHQAPAIVALAGISLAALLDALLQFVLARGGEETYMVVGWLAGSTLRVDGPQALLLLAGVTLLSALALALHRWLTLLAAGEPLAAARGLAVDRARVLLLSLGAVTAALVTASVGPVAFVGLVAPHLASLLGARRVRDQLPVAALVGILLFTLADWLGRTAFYPDQLPAGAMASILGGGYFAFLLVNRRLV